MSLGLQLLVFCVNSLQWRKQMFFWPMGHRPCPKSCWLVHFSRCFWCLWLTFLFCQDFGLEQIEAGCMGTLVPLFLVRFGMTLAATLPRLDCPCAEYLPASPPTTKQSWQCKFFPTVSTVCGYGKKYWVPLTSAFIWGIIDYLHTNPCGHPLDRPHIAGAYQHAVPDRVLHQNVADPLLHCGIIRFCGSLHRAPTRRSLASCCPRRDSQLCHFPPLGFSYF
jgi:hypothetical protein